VDGVLDSRLRRRVSSFVDVASETVVRAVRSDRATGVTARAAVRELDASVEERTREGSRGFGGMGGFSDPLAPLAAKETRSNLSPVLLVEELLEPFPALLERGKSSPIGLSPLEAVGLGSFSSFEAVLAVVSKAPTSPL
jgi:hypothetical protein